MAFKETSFSDGCQKAYDIRAYGQPDGQIITKMYVRYTQTGMTLTFSTAVAPFAVDVRPDEVRVITNYRTVESFSGADVKYVTFNVSSRCLGFKCIGEKGEEGYSEFPCTEDVAREILDIIGVNQSIRTI